MDCYGNLYTFNRNGCDWTNNNNRIWTAAAVAPHTQQRTGSKSRMPEQKANHLNWHFVGTVGAMPKCENIHEKPKWLSIFECVFCFLTKISFYLRGNVSATIECLCDDYTNRVLARRGAKFIYEWVIFIQPYSKHFKWLSFYLAILESQSFCMIIIWRCIHIVINIWWCAILL